MTRVRVLHVARSERAGGEIEQAGRESSLPSAFQKLTAPVWIVPQRARRRLIEILVNGAKNRLR